MDWSAFDGQGPSQTILGLYVSAFRHTSLARGTRGRGRGRGRVGLGLGLGLQDSLVINHTYTWCVNYYHRHEAQHICYYTYGASD